MEAADNASLQVLEAIAKTLGGDPGTRELIQSAYNIGKIDGKIEANRVAIDKLREKVAA
jgi:hypothetical protein